ncbi:MAG TPA: DUF4252 domain-containing protein [Pyrinomonadaceae bacterium]|nr:DUF4252 domain-containing protein [Pyrinomonadaceae bacterium]
MKSLFQTNIKTLLPVALLVLASAFVARAQDSRIQMSSLDHLAAKASESVDVNIDERLMKVAAKAFSDHDADEREIKKLVAGIKGIYVKSFEFDTEGQYSAADVESIRAQLRAPGWSRLLNVTSKKEGIVEVYMLMNGEEIGGLAVLAAEEKEFTVVNIVGPVDLEKLAKLEGQLGVPELGIEPTKTKTKN